MSLRTGREDVKSDYVILESSLNEMNDRIFLSLESEKKKDDCSLWCLTLNKLQANVDSSKHISNWQSPNVRNCTSQFSVGRDFVSCWRRAVSYSFRFRCRATRWPSQIQAGARIKKSDSFAGLHFSRSIYFVLDLFWQMFAVMMWFVATATPPFSTKKEMLKTTELIKCRLTHRLIVE